MIDSKHCLSIIWSPCWCRNIYFTISNFSSMKILKFRSLFNIFLDVERRVSFAPACTMIWLGFFWSNRMISWFKSLTVATGKFLNLTLRPPPHNPSSKTSLMMEWPTTNVVFIDHCLFSVVFFSLPFYILLFNFAFCYVFLSSIMWEIVFKPGISFSSF